MLSLVIETCTERAIVAFVEDGHCLFMAGLPYGFHNSRFLVPKIDEGFECIKKQPQDLDFIVVGVGPGSYTGIRVGATVAKTMSYSCKVPLVGISTLECFLPDCDGSFAAILDAKMAGTHFLKGDCKGDLITYTSPPEICKLEELTEKLSDVATLVCPHGPALRKKIEEVCPDAKWSWLETGPDPIRMSQLGKEKLDRGEYTQDGSLELLYMR